MNRILFAVLVAVLISYMISCANPLPPDGGPKDTIPPNLITSTPKNEELNYTDQTIYLEFDEPIFSNKVKSELIITPAIDIKYKIKPRKYSAQLTLQSPLDSNTTYTFNFVNGITDVTERNPAENLSIAFSTGHYIDSMYIKGKIVNLMTQQPAPKVLIALYPATDSTNMFDTKPMYFSFTNDSGTYSIQNIKAGKYWLHAFKDVNKNLKCDPDKEEHGFKSDTIKLYQAFDSLKIPIQKIDSRELQFLRARSSGHYFDIFYNKPIGNYRLSSTDTSISLYHQKITKNTTIRFYPSHSFIKQYPVDLDSLKVIVSASDTINNTIHDTTYIKFTTSRRKKEDLSYKLLTKSTLPRNQIVQISTSKPIEFYTLDSSLYYLDSIYQSPIDTVWFNDNHNIISVRLNITLDSLTSLVDTLTSMYQIDSAITQEDSIQLRTYLHFSNLDPNRIDIIMPFGTFVSADGDTLPVIKSSFKLKQSLPTSAFYGSISTDTTHFFFQLLNSKSKVVRSLYSPTKYHFKNLQPGSYTLRILVDSNADERFSYGNYHTGQEPEPVLILNELIELRDNWELSDVDISF